MAVMVNSSRKETIVVWPCDEEGEKLGWKKKRVAEKNG